MKWQKHNNINYIINWNGELTKHKHIVVNNTIKTNRDIKCMFIYYKNFQKLKSFSRMPNFQDYELNLLQLSTINLSHKFVS